MSYTQLSATERFTLYQLHITEQQSIRDIARSMDCSESTISRELRRNRIDKKLYLPDTAQIKMQTRRQQSKQPFMSVSESTIEQVKQRLEEYHSPEQLAGRMEKDGLERVSHETIYQMIYANHQGLGEYQRYLRQGQKQRRRKGINQKRGGIPGRVGIEHRPAIADLKTEIGHWESDTVIGVNHTGILVTHVDKASKFLLAGLAKNKTVQQINQVTIGLFGQIGAALRKTMTFDNGKEFSGHQKLAEALDVSCFFANPYHSWERGLNVDRRSCLRIRMGYSDNSFPRGLTSRL